MGRSLTEQIRELEKTVAALQQRLAYAEKNAEDTLRSLRELERLTTDLREETTRFIRDSERAAADLRQELALVRQRLDDHLKRVELWDSRRWGFILAIAVALFGASAAFTSGLIIATLRK